MKPFSHSDAFIRSLAKRRRSLHTGQKSQNILSDDGDYNALLGESAFAYWSKLPLDTSDRIDGDKGVDFVTSSARVIDVKTAKHTGLLVQENKLKLDTIYVLARPSGELVGWALGSELAKVPARVTHPKEGERRPSNHMLMPYQLAPMSALHPLL